MSEFRPPARPSAFRVVFAIVIAVFCLGPSISLAVVAMGMRPIRYSIGSGTLVVKSGDVFFGERSMQLSEIAETRVVQLHGGRRTNGTAMPGYCVGHFTYPDLGSVWQATNCAGRALLVRGKTAPTPLLLTPPDLEAFAASITSGTDTTITLATPTSNPLAWAALAALVVSLIVSTLVVGLLVFGPKRMRYSIEGGELHVRTLFGHKHWPICEVRARRYRPTRMWRVAGSAVPGYFTGLFREHGQSVRVYATDTSLGVLLEAPERVFINPEDEQGFFAALEKAGGTTLEGPP